MHSTRYRESKNQKSQKMNSNFFIFTHFFCAYLLNCSACRGGSFDAIKPLTTAHISNVVSRIAVRTESQGPALIGEWLPVKILVSSKDDVGNVSLSLKIVHDSGGHSNNAVNNGIDNTGIFSSTFE